MSSTVRKCGTVLSQICRYVFAGAMVLWGCSSTPQKPATGVTVWKIANETSAEVNLSCTCPKPMGLSQVISLDRRLASASSKVHLWINFINEGAGLNVCDWTCIAIPLSGTLRSSQPTQFRTDWGESESVTVAAEGDRLVVRASSTPPTDPPVVLSSGEPEFVEPHFGYVTGSKDGPENWGSLSPDWATCASGRSQSSINLTNATMGDLANISFDWKPSKIMMVNNGHTVQYVYDSGSSITVNGKTYSLVQFHFHSRSEHIVDGKSSQLEAHFVHREAGGTLAVVGVLMDMGANSFPALASFSSLPAEGMSSNPEGMVNASDLLPPAADRSYYTYSGSLTTPPCSESVTWLVMKQKVQIQSAQIEMFSKLFPEGNARPSQPLNGRELLLDMTP